MVDVLGHVAMGLLWTVPAWFLWEQRISLTFIGFVLFAVMIPDVDINLPGVVHHGVTHTVVFVTGVALFGGALVTLVSAPMLRRWWRQSDRKSASRTVFGLTSGGLFVGGLSHLLIDMLSAGATGNPPLEPFWRVSQAVLHRFYLLQFVQVKRWPPYRGTRHSHSPVFTRCAPSRSSGSNPSQIVHTDMDLMVSCDDSGMREVGVDQ